MKIRKANRQRATARPLYRVEFTPDTDHPAWATDGALPTPATVPEAFSAWKFELQPRPPKSNRRLPLRDGLSIGALKKRLFQAGAAPEQVNSLARAIHAGPTVPSRFTDQRRVLGWPLQELEARFGHRLARAVRKNLRVKVLFVDEFWSMVNAQALSTYGDSLRYGRKYNGADITVTQTGRISSTEPALAGSPQHD